MNITTMIALANLDWLQLHAGGRLDFAAGAVLADTDGEPLCLVSDLETEGLTPATAPFAVVIPQPDDLIGKVVKIRVKTVEWHGYDEEWKVRSPALPPEER